MDDDFGYLSPSDKEDFEPSSLNKDDDDNRHSDLENGIEKMDTSPDKEDINDSNHDEAEQSSSKNNQESIEEDDDKSDEEYVYVPSPKKEEPYEFVPPSQRDDAPLAGIVYPELEDIDPR